jgi:hypothetical protein
MGEMTFIKAGIATTIHDNGDVTSRVTVICDGCHKESSPDNGRTVVDTGGEVLLWLCEACKG